MPLNKEPKPKLGNYGLVSLFNDKQNFLFKYKHQSIVSYF